jgi:hypothetical protein
MPLRMTQPPFFTVVCKRKDLPFIVGRADRVSQVAPANTKQWWAWPKPRCCHDGVALSSLSLGGKVLTRSTYPNIIESYPVVCILSPKPQKTFIMPRVDRAFNASI